MIKPWILAARPKTLVASFAPVLVGAFLAKENTGFFDFLPLALCLIFALLIQIGTNFANDYFDFQHGADTKERIGPARMVSSGLISPKWMLAGTALSLLAAFSVGILLMEVVQANRLLLGVGIVSVLSALAYTGGPFPLAYHGLGDCFVILFFGLLAVCLTEYVLMCSAEIFWTPSWGMGLGVGFIINNLLVVNNYRDFEEDGTNGKNTLVVLFGKKFGLFFYAIGFFGATVACSLFYEQARFTLLLVPLGILALRRLARASEAKDYNNVLGLSAVIVVLYAILTAFGIFWESR